jgi:hypothetical protein
MRDKDSKIVALLEHPSRIGFPSNTWWCTSRQHIEELKRKTYPVKIIVPGSRVVPCDKNEMILGTEKIRSLLDQHDYFDRHGDLLKTHLLDCVSAELASDGEVSD